MESVTRSNGKGRIEYLDQIRGVSILLVVFCHYTLLGNSSLVGNMIMCIAWGAVPCFFMVSGGVMHQKKEFLWKPYFYRLMQVYFGLCVWKLIYLLINGLLHDLSFSKVDLIKYLFFFGSIDGVDTVLMWFAQAYLLVLIFYPITWFLFRHFSEGKKILLFILVMLFALGSLVHSLNLLFEVISSRTGENLLNLDSFAAVLPFSTMRNALFYFLLGAFLFYYKDRIGDFFREKVRRVWIPVVCIAAGMVGLMCIRHWQTGTFRWEGTYLSDGYLWISTIAIAVGLYLLIQNYLGRIRVRWLSCFGRNTMGIYYIHYILLEILFAMAFWSTLTAHGSVPVNLLKTAVVAVVSLFITMGLKKIPVVKLLVN